jgi:hypothetical protein
MGNRGLLIGGKGSGGRECQAWRNEDVLHISKADPRDQETSAGHTGWHGSNAGPPQGIQAVAKVARRMRRLAMATRRAGSSRAWNSPRPL